MIQANLGTIINIRNRFKSNAKIILYACNTGVGNSLLASISQAFQVCVKGFSDEILWCLMWDTNTRAITVRGRVFSDTEGHLALGLIDCEDFHQNISSLNPDREKL